MPVFNGEKYLAKAIEAILQQDFAELELIICDNASTDSTRQICAEYSKHDARVRYHRHEANMGAAANFNSTVSMATAPYFMWAADDDYYEPTYISRCLAVLDVDPDVVLCSTLVRIVDSDDQPVADYDSQLDDAGDQQPVDRLGAVIMHRHLCTDMFGVMRIETLKQTECLNEYYGADRGFLAEMVLLGRFSKIREPLFNNREHPQRDSRLGIDYQLSRGQRMPVWKLYRQYRRAIRRHVENRGERNRCFRLLARWWFVDWNYARLCVDVVGSIWSSIYRIVNRLKVSIYGPVPQIYRKR